MSGFEPMFMAAAAETVAPAAIASLGAEVGTAALLTEVAGTGMMMGLPTLGASIVPTAMNGLAALPQAAGLAGSLTPAVTPALTGLASGQVPALLNQSLQGVLSAPEIAQMTKGATDIVANAKNLGQVAQAASPTITDAGMQNVFNAYRQAAPVAQELVSQASQIVPEVSSAYTGAATPATAFPSGSSAYTSAAAPPAAATAAKPGFLDTALDYVKNNKMNTLSMGMNAMNLLGKGKKGGKDEDEEYDGPLSKFKYDPSRYVPGTVTPPTPYKPVYKDYRMAGGGVVELMSDQNAIGANTGYPMADINKGAYATPYQQPISRNMLTGASDTGVDPMTGEMQFAGGGIADLGGYSDGGRMLKGPGDGMSDNIPATIAGKQPARLANEEFVIPADVVSHLGNGSSEAGAKQLYKMMDRVRQARTGKKAQGKQIKADRYMPA